MSVQGNFSLLEKSHSDINRHFLEKPQIGSLALQIADLWWRCALLTRELLRPFTNQALPESFADLEKSLQALIRVLEFRESNLQAVVQVFVEIIDQMKQMQASQLIDTDFQIGNLEGTRRQVLAMKIREELFQIWNIQFV